MRIALDESGTHSDEFLIIGILVVPNPEQLIQRLSSIKENHGYYNTKGKNSAKYKEIHYKEIYTPKDRDVAKEWINEFTKYQCWYRCIVIDWSIWDPRHFGGPFESGALKKRRAYKKWAEMLIHPEVRTQTGVWLRLDNLTACHKYEVIDRLKDKFGNNYKGRAPRISKFEKVSSWQDGNQDVQLCDLLTGCVYNSLVTPTGKMGKRKTEVRHHLFNVLQPFGVKNHEMGYWKGFDKSTLRQHFPKFSEWFWRPE